MIDYLEESRKTLRTATSTSNIMASPNRSKLVRMTIKNIGCIGNEGLTIELDNIVCIVGKNNSGKTTILRSYELAIGQDTFKPAQDRNLQATEDQPSEVLMEVHIPDRIGNIDSRWKTDDGSLRIVKSRWQWLHPNYKRCRTTWDPKGGKDGNGEWAEDGKAGGADPVFNSRLPRAVRIGSLDDSDKIEEALTTLILEPLIQSIDTEFQKENSDLNHAMQQVANQVKALSSSHKEYFSGISNQLTRSLKDIFPGMEIDIDIPTSSFIQKPSEIIKNGSKIKIIDSQVSTTISQQGTGARRAIFWSMLQVKNIITKEKEIRKEHSKDLKSKIKKLESEKSKKGLTETQKKEIGQKIEKLNASLKAHDEGAPIPDGPEDPALPGYILLIDEPENALHPMAARAAQRHLYNLAKNSDWQVMLTTHSPCFINPFEDHTTITRLDRPYDIEGEPHPVQTYRSDLISFDSDEKQRLQALQHIDPGFSEIFFGSYPIIVEGNTEHAAFIASIIETNHPIINKSTIIRAQGKAILASLIKVMEHFKIDFGVIHDSDTPFTKTGTRNSMWAENEKIRNAIIKAQSNGIKIRHRVSIPDFERFLGENETDKDKPLKAYQLIQSNDDLKRNIQNLLAELIHGVQHEPFELSGGKDYMETLEEKVLNWAASNGLKDDPRFICKTSSPSS